MCILKNLLLAGGLLTGVIATTSYAVEAPIPNWHELSSEEKISLLKNVASNGNLSIIQRCWDQEYKEYQDQKIVYHAVKDAILLGAVENGQLEVVQWFWDQSGVSKKSKERALWIAAAAGQFAIVDWCWNQLNRFDRELCGRLPYDSCYLILRHRAIAEEKISMLKNAASKGDLSIIQRCWDQEYKKYQDQKIVYHAVKDAILLGAAENGQLEVVKWCWAKSGIFEEEDKKRLIEVAEAAGYGAIVEWCWNQLRNRFASKGCYFRPDDGWNLISKDPDHRAIVSAAENGHLEIVQWFCRFSDISFGAKIRKIGAALMGAARGGKLNVLQWCLNQYENLKRNNNGLWLKFVWDAVIEAATNGHLEVVQVLCGRYNNYKKEALIHAVWNGQLKVLQWWWSLPEITQERKNEVLVELMVYRNPPVEFDDRVTFNYDAYYASLMNAVWRGTLQWWWSQPEITQKTKNEVLVSAVKNGLLYLVQWCWSQPDITADIKDKALKVAREYGQQDIVAWIERQPKK